MKFVIVFHAKSQRFYAMLAKIDSIKISKNASFKKSEVFFYLKKIFLLPTSDFLLLNIFYKLLIFIIHHFKSGHFFDKEFENFSPSIFVIDGNAMFFYPKSGNHFSVF